MEHAPAAEILPVMYRAVLDAVAVLEARGRRREAAAIREEATRAYSKAWNAAAARRMQALETRAARLASNGGHAKDGRLPRSLGRRADFGQTSA